MISRATCVAFPVIKSHVFTRIQHESTENVDRVMDKVLCTRPESLEIARLFSALYISYQQILTNTHELSATSCAHPAYINLPLLPA